MAAVYAATINKALAAGIHWLVYVNDAGITEVSSIGEVKNYIYRDGVDFNTNQSGYRHDLTYGALPSTFPSATPYRTNDAPFMALRVASIP